MLLTLLLNYAIIIPTKRTAHRRKDKMKKVKVLTRINYLYSIAWIKATGKDKFAFREESKVHEFLMNQITDITLKTTK